VFRCVYNRNSKNFKDKNKKANSSEKVDEKFNLSCLFQIQNRCFLPPQSPPFCLLRFSCEHNVCVHLTFLLNEMYGFSGLCDRLRIYGHSSLCDVRSVIVCDHMETSLNLNVN